MTAPTTSRFTVLRRLGEGGMGVVYEAFDGERRLPVALKTLSRFDGAALARFKREFRSLQGLAHPNLVALDELFFENGQWFFTMELVDGVDFVSHVRGHASRIQFQSTVRASAARFAAERPIDPEPEGDPGAVDAAKLRGALAQLAQALAALHAADKVHRDVKPSNVMVTRQGRVVLLDFGLVTEALSEDVSTGNAVVGTPAYMAPEQAASRELTPAADMYAVGVMLFEALTGRVPIDGAPLQVLLEKQSREPVAPSTIAPGVPSDLDALCVGLLRFDPAKRPTAADVLRAVSAGAAGASMPPKTTTDSGTFVGRGDELAALRDAFATSARGRLATVLVCGESGIGKSFLVRRFLGELAADRPDAIVLEGRCYERETVPYKALDGIVDALSLRLSRMASDEVAAVLPVRASIVAEVFPVLLRVPAIAKDRAARVMQLDAHELRRRAFAGLREMLTRLTLRRPMAVAIDDLQWADEDGLRGLADVLRAPDAPSLLLIGTVRVSPGAASAPLERLRAALSGDVRTIDLASLGPDEARELAETLLHKGGARGVDPATIAGEARGHPLFVEELARHVALGGSAPSDVKLDDAIGSRVAQLDPKAREVAELVAIAGKPIPQDVVASAAHVPAGELQRRAAMLRAANVVRTGGARMADAIEPYHDRVREAVLARTGDARRRALHEALAIAYEASSRGDPETLATHWREAGNGSQAATYAESAGDAAAKTFAFDRAAQWFEQAIELAGDRPRRELQVKLGDALSNAGRGALAAPHYEAAAEGAPRLDAIELRRRAADQLLRTGHFDRGVEASRALLAEIGVRLPTTAIGTIAMLAWWRLVAALRGLRFRARDAGQVTAEELVRFDVCWSLAMDIAMAETVVGAALHARAFVLALAIGEIERVTAVVTGEAWSQSVPGGRAWKNTERLLGKARELVDRCGTHKAQTMWAASRGAALTFVGRFREAEEQLTQAIEMLREGEPELVMERVTMRVILLSTLAMQGRFAALQREQDDGLRDALARGDVYASVHMRIGAANSAWLAQDRPDLSERHEREAMSEWTRRGFTIEHFYAGIGHVSRALYLGRPQEAYAASSALMTKMRWTFLWLVQVVRVRLLQQHAASALACVAAGCGDRAALLRDAKRATKRIARERLPWTDPLATSLRAGIALHEGDRDGALRALDDSARAFDAESMRVYAASARHRAAILRGDAGEQARAVALFRDERIVVPERMIEMHLPGFVA